jgi:Replication-relaxation
VQVLVRAGRADLSAAVAALRESAPALPYPALEQAALEHAGFLEGLAEERDVLTRRALLVIREPGHGAGRAGGGTAAGRALHRAGEAPRLLAGADLQVTTLYQYRAVDRFRPLAATGSSPLHFVLDEAGALLLAAEDGITTADLGYRRDRAMSVTLSPHLSHDVGANGVFTHLAAAARASGGHQALETWWGRRRCAAVWGENTRPDGYGRWREQLPGRPGAVTDFFLEYDTGTEPLARVIGKLDGYAALAARTGITTPVLFRLAGVGHRARRQQRRRLHPR